MTALKTTKIRVPGRTIESDKHNKMAVRASRNAVNEFMQSISESEV